MTSTSCSTVPALSIPSDQHCNVCDVWRERCTILQERVRVLECQLEAASPQLLATTPLTSSQTSDDTTTDETPVTDDVLVPTAVAALPAAPAELKQLFAEAAITEAEPLFECSVGDTPQTTAEVAGECTVVHVTAANRPRLLADLTAVLAGLELYIAKMFSNVTGGEAVEAFDAEETASFEFWVQEPGPEHSSLNPVRERMRRRAIEKRLSKWSAGRVLERQAKTRAEGGIGAAEDTPNWCEAPALPSHPETLPEEASSAEMEQRDTLLAALTAALCSSEITWLGAVNPVLARRTAAALLPRMRRLQLAPGAHIDHMNMSDEWLVLIEEPLVVTCTRALSRKEMVLEMGRRRAKSWQDLSEALDEWWHVPHPAGSVLCQCSSLGFDATDTAIETRNGGSSISIAEVAKAALTASAPAPSSAYFSEAKLGATAFQEPRLAWHAIRVPASGSVVSVVSHVALRELLVETRKGIVAKNAQTLASVQVFSPLTTGQLVAVCQRAVEVDAKPFEQILLHEPPAGASTEPPSRLKRSLSFALPSPPALRKAITSGVLDEDQHKAVRSPKSLASLKPCIRSTMPALLSSSRVSESASAVGSAGATSRRFLVLLRGSMLVKYSPKEPEEGLISSLPLARLQPMEAIGQVAVLCGPWALKNVSFIAGEDGATVLSWNADEFLQRELLKLPGLLESSFFCKSPFALCAWVPQLLSLVKPTTLSELSARFASRAIHTPELCVVLRGTLYYSVDDQLVVSVAATSEASTSPTTRHRRQSVDPRDILSQSSLAQVEAISSGHTPRKRRSSVDERMLPSALRGKPRSLVIKIEIPTHGKKLAQISKVLDRLGLNVISAQVNSVGDVAKETFHVRYIGELSPSEIEMKLRQCLRDSLRMSKLLPGDTFFATEARSLTPSAPGETEESSDVLLGMVNLRTFGTALAQAPADELGHRAGELWQRFLQVRKPSLLMSMVSPHPRGGVLVGVNGSCEAEAWLGALNNFALLFMRERAGGAQLADGVQMRDLLIGPMLGEGAYGVVRLARHRVLCDHWFAVKRVPVGKLRASPKGKLQLRYLEREREVLILLARETRGTPYRELFVHLVTTTQDCDSLQLVMPAVLGGELFHLLEEHGKMEEPAVVFYAACLTLALQHLHRRGIAYRDLKSENVLLTGGVSSSAAGWPVLADFGLANFAKSENLTTFCGTAAFIAPEVAASTGHGTAADWWSLGILICQCLTLTTPFEGPNPKATVDNVLHGRRVSGPSLAFADETRSDDPTSSEISSSAAKMIDALLQHDPAERLGGPLQHSSEVRVQPFFWGFDWTRIEKRQMTPPHAKLCHERAAAAIAHPALKLPVLPHLRKGGAQEQKDAESVPDEAPSPSTIVADRLSEVPVSPSPWGGEVRISHQEQDESLREEEDEDMLDYL